MKERIISDTYGSGQCFGSDFASLCTASLLHGGRTSQMEITVSVAQDSPRSTDKILGNRA